MSRTAGYAVIWQRPNGPTYAGRIEVEADRIRMAGTAPEQHRTQLEQIPLVLVESAWIARSPEERLKHLPTLVVEVRGGSTLRIAALDGPGKVHELTRRICDRIPARAAR